MLIGIKMTFECVAAEVDENDPKKTVDLTTKEELEYNGAHLKDFVRFFLMDRTGVQDEKHIFSAQEVMNVIMAEPIRRVNNSFAQSKMAEIDQMFDGERFRDKMDAFMESLKNPPPPENEKPEPEPDEKPKK